jgi:hypothetical protein
MLLSWEEVACVLMGDRVRKIGQKLTTQPNQTISASFLPEYLGPLYPPDGFQIFSALGYHLHHFILQNFIIIK